MQMVFSSKKLNDMLDESAEPTFTLYVMDDKHVMLGSVIADSVKNFWEKTKGKTGQIPRAFFEMHARSTHSKTLVAIREDAGALDSGKDLILSITTKA